MKDIKTIDRDLSWMYFNHRILEEARRQDVPVIERLGFLGIYSNNLDEFFRVRMANINRILAYKPEGRNLRNCEKAEIEHAKKLQKELNKLNAQYSKEFGEAVVEVENTLKKEHIMIVDDTQIDEKQRDYVMHFYQENLIGRVLPLWLDNIKQFEYEADDMIYFIVKLREGERKPQYALLPLPVGCCGRWITVPAPADVRDDQACYVMYLDDIIRICLPMFFPGMPFDSYEAYSFKFTRDAELEIDNVLDQAFMQKIANGVKSRKTGFPLRLVYDHKMPEGMLRRIKQRLNGNGSLDTAVAGGKYQNHRDMMKFPDCGRKDLRYPKWQSILPAEFCCHDSLFDAIRRKDLFLHVPYHSFNGYIRMLNEAAMNPAVKSIKTTLYRLAKDSKVIRALIAAAQNGKKVTVVIELLARFDEASNIRWSKKMQDAGINVIFGVEGLKVHSKITHISFTKGSDIACISTGNFHEGNAAAYTDVLMFTANRNLTADVEKVFKFIEKPYATQKFRELLVSPNEMKKKFIALIDNETRNHLAGKPSYIKVKVNHITDPDIIKKIYDAACAGVRIDLLVRGNCSLVDSKEFNGNMHVKGIIDRYLEHSRIFRFCNNGDEKVFIGSADWMPRNLDSRIEVVTPVYAPEIKAECQRIVDYGLQDNTHSHKVIGEPAKYEEASTPFRSQEELYKYYIKLAEEQTQG